MDRLKGKRAAFCRWYLALGNPREAALRAGCPPDSAADDGLEMLRSAYCRRMLAQLAQQPPVPVQALVSAGLTRLAFGDANDAARLLTCETLTDEQIAGLDLFHVTAMKRDRNGVEIKLADRLSAMEKLLQCANSADHAAAAAALLTALRGAPDEGEVVDDAQRDGCSADEAVFSETA